MSEVGSRTLFDIRHDPGAVTVRTLRVSRLLSNLIGARVYNRFITQAKEAFSCTREVYGQAINASTKQSVVDRSRVTGRCSGGVDEVVLCDVCVRMLRMADMTMVSGDHIHVVMICVR